MRILSSIVLLICSMCFSATSSAFDWCEVDWSNYSPGQEVNLAFLLGREPVDFFPFTEEEVREQAEQSDGLLKIKDHTDNQGKVIYSEILFIDISENVASKMDLQQWLASLNESEKELNKAGISLRNDEDDLHEELWAIFQNPDHLEQAFLNELKMYAANKFNECMDQIDPGQCPQIKIDDVYEIPGVKPQQRIEIGDGTEITIEELVRSTNNTAKLGCAVGINLYSATSGVSFEFDENLDITWLKFDSLNLDFDWFKGMIDGSIDFAISDLGLPKDLLSPLLIKFHALNLNFPEIELEIDLYLEKLKISSMEKLNLLIAELNLDGLDYKIENVPNWPSVEEPVPPPLKIKKRKEWKGFDIGNKKIMSAHAYAWTELRGGESEQSAQAYGVAGGYVFRQELSLLSASADFYAGTTKVKAKVKARVVGYDWIDYNYQHESALKYAVGEKQTQRIAAGQAQFTVGPVLITIRAGAFFEAGVKYEIGLALLKLHGELTPYAKAGVYAQAEASIFIIAIGAIAELDLVNLEVPLVAQAALKFEDSGAPYLDLGIYADATYSFLSGRLIGYVKYYVPRFGVPPWKKKKKSKVIFRWSGKGASYRIMEWGVTYGRNGLKRKGELFDMTGFDISSQLDNAATREDRAVLMMRYQSDSKERMHDLLQEIDEELKSNQNVEGTSIILIHEATEVSSKTSNFISDLEG